MPKCPEGFRTQIKGQAPPARQTVAVTLTMRSHDSQNGFTIIEVLVTALMVMLMSAGVATALISTAHASGDQRLRSQADALATQDQERLRGLSDEQLATLNGSSTQTRPVTVDVNGQDVRFSVESTAAFANSQGDSSCASSAATFYKATSTVSWNEGFNGSSQSLTEDSLISRPVTGQLLTTVQDQTGSPLSGVSVSATPQPGQQGLQGQQGTSDNNGCVLLAGLQAGAYDVAVSRSGYVDEDGDASQNPSPVATLADTDTTAVSTPGNPFTLGLAGAVDATFTSQTDKGASVPAEADGVSWLDAVTPAGAKMDQSGVAPVTVPPAPLVAVTTPSDLFPFDMAVPTATPSYADNYAVWGGRCASQEPPGEEPQFSVGPGVTASSPTVQEPFLSFSSFSATVGKVVHTVPSDIVLSYTGTNSDGSTSCHDSWRAEVAAPGAGNAVPSTGWLKYPGQPYAAQGTLTVCADFRSSSGSYVHGSVPSGNTSLIAENQVPAITATLPGACST